MSADSDPSATNVTHQSGGADLNAGRDINIAGDVVGRDKIVDESITTGDIKNVSGNLVIGRNVNVSVNSASRGVTVEEYLAAVRAYCANLPYLTLQDIRPSKTLEEVYVPLSLRSWQRRESEKPKDIQEGAERDVLRPESLSIAAVMQSRDVHHIFILGEPGSGKSSLLRYMAEKAWDESNAIGLNERHLPLLISLRQLASVSGSLDERMRSVLSNGLSLARAIPEGFLEDWAGQRDARWLILLDALDEVPSNVSAEFILWLKGQLRHLAAHSIVITSRSLSLAATELDEKAFDHYEVRPFEPDQIKEFAAKWFPGAYQKFIDELDRLRFDLRGEPLLLTIAATIFAEKSRLPERLSDLYRDFVRAWLEEANLGERLNKDLGGNLAASTDLHFGRLAHLALLMTQESTSTAPGNLAEFVGPGFGEHFVKVMARRSGVFIERRSVYEFIHPTFREYLAAYAAVHESNLDHERVWELVIQHWPDKDWIQVTLFALNILNGNGDISELIERMCLSDDMRWPLFTGLVLLDSTGVKIETGNRVIRGLIALTRSDEWQNLAVYMLIALHERPRAMDGLLVLMRDTNMSPWLRVWIAEWLSEFPGQADKVTPMLLALARGYALEYTGVRGASGKAVDALARLRRDADLLLLVHGIGLDSDVRRHGAKALGRLGRIDEACSGLLAMTHSPYLSVKERVEAAEEVIILGHGGEVIAILQAVAYDMSVDTRDRASAARALANAGQIGEALEILGAIAKNLDDDARTYEIVAETLVQLGQTNEAATVFRALASDTGMSIWWRVSAVKALWQLGQTTSAVSILTALANDENEDVFSRIETAEALNELGYVDESVSTLLKVAEEVRADAADRIRAAEALGKLHQIDGAVSILLAVLHAANAEPDTQIQAVEALIELGKIEEVGSLLNELVHNGRLEVEDRLRVAEILGKHSHVDTALNILLPLTCNMNMAPKVRARAIGALGELGRSDESAATEIVPALFTLSRNMGDDEVAVDAAIEALGSLGWVSKLHLLVDDKDLDMWRRAKAAEILGQGDKAAVFYLEQVTENNGLWVAGKLVRLGWIDAAVSLLFTQALNRSVSNTGNRFTAAQNLGRLGRVDEAATILLSLAREPGDGRIENLEIVKALGELDRVEDLRALAHDSSVPNNIRGGATETLARLGHTEIAAVAWAALARTGNIPQGPPIVPWRGLGRLGRTNDLRTLANDAHVAISVRIGCAEALGVLGQSDESSAILLAIALDNNAGFWSQNEALAALGTLNRTDDLLALSNDETYDEWLQQCAINALGNSTDARVLQNLDQIALTEVNELKRSAARRAAEHIRSRLGLDSTDPS